MNRIQKALVKVAGLSWLVDAANPLQRYQRPFEPLTLGPSYVDINMADRAVLISDSLKLYHNLGPVKAMVDDKATYSIGRAWAAKSLATDRAWAKRAEQWVNDMWYPMADARGGMFDFVTDLFLMSVSIDREGEIFVLLTESESGWPQIQLLPTRMIGTRGQESEVLESGPYAGLRMIQGVVFNPVGRAVAFQVLGDKQAEDVFYSARDLIQVFDPSSVDQVHGLPAMTHALLDMKTLRSVQGYESIAAMLISQIGLIENNELGAPDASDPTVLLTRGSTAGGSAAANPSVITQESRGVTTRFFRAGSGSSLQQLKSERPGDAVAAFMDRLIRNACAGNSWPFEMVWDASKLGGANVRLLVARAMRTVNDRQDLIKPIARRMVGYAVAKAIKQGFLEQNAEWYSWEFSLPPLMTSDYGRDSNADRADYAAGLTTMTDILAAEGIGLEQHIAKLKREREMLAAAGITSATPPES